MENEDIKFHTMTVDDLAKSLKCCKSYAYKIMKRDDFPSLKLGKEYRVEQQAFIDWYRKGSKEGF